MCLPLEWSFRGGTVFELSSLENDQGEQEYGVMEQGVIYLRHRGI